MATAAELAALSGRIANVLTGPACASIGFTVGGVRIRPGGFMVVGMSLVVPHSGPMPGAAHRPMSARVSTHLPPGAGACYLAGPNVIVVPRADYGVGANECRAFVHEATHAVFDYNRIRADAWTEEAAAYIAGALYSLFVLAAPSPATSGNGIFAAAEVIAARIRAPQRIGGPPNDVVTQADSDALIAVIRASPTYAPLADDGPGYRYRHNGGGI